MELAEAKRTALELVTAGPVRWIGIDEAPGRVLAGMMRADTDLPREPRSRLDGYAILSSDTREASPQAPVLLEVSREILAAGHSTGHRVKPGQCSRILTGAPLPRGTDAVAAQELVSDRGSHVAVSRPLVSGTGITQAGDEVRSGEIVLTEGCILTPTRLALIAALGHIRVPVHAAPTVSLLATGDELREPGESPSGPSSYCNNRLLLSWLTSLHGGKPTSLGIAGDDSGTIAERLEGADTDFVITTGGTGRGNRDLIRQVWQRLGVRTVFEGIGISPGKSSALGTRGHQVFCALSGNPWGAQVVFEEIISPMLWRRQGIQARGVPEVAAILNGTLRKPTGIARAFHGKLDMGTLPPAFTPAEKGKESRASLFSMLKDCPTYVLLEPHRTEVNPGEMVLVHFHDITLNYLPHFDVKEDNQGVAPEIHALRKEKLLK